MLACSKHACVPITCILTLRACRVSLCMCKCPCRSVSVCTANVVEVSVSKCKCRSVSVQGTFRKNPSQCFREKPFERPKNGFRTEAQKRATCPKIYCSLHTKPEHTKDYYHESAHQSKVALISCACHEKSTSDHQNTRVPLRLPRKVTTKPENVHGTTTRAQWRKAPAPERQFA